MPNKQTTKNMDVPLKKKGYFMKRNEGESFEAYRNRRASEKTRINNYLKGRLVWNSHDQGTYIRKRNGELR